MNAYEKSVALGLAGTDQEILDQMKALTADKIDRNNLLTWLDDGDYWAETPGGMTGDLTAAYDASAGNLRKTFNRVWRWLFNRDDLDELRTTKPTQADDLLSIINKISTMDGSLRNAYFALGGGAPYRGVDVADFTAQRVAGEAQAAIDAAKLVLETVADDAYQVFIDKYNSAKAGIQDGTLTTEAAVTAVLEA